MSRCAIQQRTLPASSDATNPSATSLSLDAKLTNTCPLAAAPGSTTATPPADAGAPTPRASRSLPIRRRSQQTLTEPHHQSERREQATTLGEVVFEILAEREADLGRGVEPIGDRADDSAVEQVLGRIILLEEP